MSLRPSELPLSDAEIEELQGRLDAVPPPLDPLDASAVDGFLAGIVLQQAPLAPAAWLRFVTDVDGRALPAGFDATRLQALVLRRHAELEAAVAKRRWFDPWVFELEAAETPSDAVLGWVGGFATAMEHFPGPLAKGGPAVVEPLALLYRHLDPEDLEDADELLEEIESLEPPADTAEAVEELVRATLLLADVSRPLPKRPGPPVRRRR